jgi:hypothetical protein
MHGESDSVLFAVGNWARVAGVRERQARLCTEGKSQGTQKRMGWRKLRSDERGKRSASVYVYNVFYERWTRCEHEWC